MNITKPTLILDKNKCLKNIEAMAAKAAKHQLKFRPHFKTHQSHEIGRWFRDYGVKAITVSSVDMAKYFAEDGWTDITIAFPFNCLEIDEVNELASKINLNITIVHPESIEFLKKHLRHELGIFIKIDTGYHRTGILADRFDLIDEIIREIGEFPQLQFKGFLTHAGNTYQANSIDEINTIHGQNLAKMNNLKQHYLQQCPDLELSIGDTPSCSLADDFDGINEIRPGNFVFYDVMQYFLGSCSAEQIAIAMACPIVAKHEDRHEIVIYGGGVHLSKESATDKNGNKCFGLVVEFTQDNWPTPIENTFVSSLSQEHGIIRTTPEVFSRLNPGDIIGVLPIHSCLTANLMKEYHTLNGHFIPHRNRE